MKDILIFISFVVAICLVTLLGGMAIIKSYYAEKKERFNSVDSISYHYFGDSTSDTMFVIIEEE